MESIRLFFFFSRLTPESVCPHPSNVLTPYISILCCLGAFTAGLCGGHFCSRGGNNISWGECKDVGFISCFKKYLPGKYSNLHLFFRQLCMVLGVKLMEISSNLVVVVEVRMKVFLAMPLLY